MSHKPVAFSAIQPSGAMTLGNYIGAIKNWLSLQKDYFCYFCVADLHTITVKQSPKEFRKNSLDLAALFMAAGLDEEEHVIFLQSTVASHAELSWILGCYTYVGELFRMTQFKDKSKKYQQNINSGLFTYPILMAADILLYKTEIVPVGEDQKQHVELTRNIAQRFNALYGETFNVPKPFIARNGAKIMSLQNPTQKMSKSDANENSYILLLDDEDSIVKKIRRAVTDSDGEVRRGDEKHGVKNLMNIYGVLLNKNDDEIEQEFSNSGYGVFKEAVAQAVIDALKPLRKRYDELIRDRAYVENICRLGMERAESIAQSTMDEVYSKIGFLPL